MEVFSLCYMRLECRVHEGFYNSYIDINAQVIDKVKAYKAQYNLDKVT